jgi:two-component system, OmpR family, alkaline phosphatase synthesis response regulator PhoP
MEDSNGKKILVIEDERPLQEAIVDTLKQHRFAVVTAEDGKGGLATAFQEHPHLILLDILMPKMDGLTVLEALNLNPDADKTIRTIMDHKPAFYLIKSNVTLEGIVSKIQEVLNM